MPWIVDKPISQEELAESFRKQMTEKGILQIPGAHDAMAGLMAQQAVLRACIYRVLLIQQALGFQTLVLLIHRK